jgi:hypothetical protein
MALLSNVRGVVRTYFLRHRSGGLEDHPLDLQVYLTGLRPESPVWAAVPQQTVARHVPRWDMWSASMWDEHLLVQACSFFNGGIGIDRLIQRPTVNRCCSQIAFLKTCPKFVHDVRDHRT